MAMGRRKRKETGAKSEMETSGEAPLGRCSWRRDCVAMRRPDSVTIEASWKAKPMISKWISP
jgi:hypothetical protein